MIMNYFWKKCEKSNLLIFPFPCPHHELNPICVGFLDRLMLISDLPTLSGTLPKWCQGVAPLSELSDLRWTAMPRGRPRRSCPHFRCFLCRRHLQEGPWRTNSIQMYPIMVSVLAVCISVQCIQCISMFLYVFYYISDYISSTNRQNDAAMQ